MRRIPVPKIEGSHCFACGDRNPQGLNMSFYVLGDSVRSEISLDGHHVGWENIAHGGIVSTLLDEIMAWTVIAFKRVFFVTHSMEVRYLRPVPVHLPLTAIGQIADDSEPHPRGCKTKGVLVDAEGNRYAEAHAHMAYLSAKRLPMIPPLYRGEMENVFAQLQALLAQDQA
jgi:acyl-coenzyme A thioesterase PaaI-like protein